MGDEHGFNMVEFWQTHFQKILLAVLGGLILTVGVIAIKRIGGDRDTQVEIVSGGEKQASESAVVPVQIAVDVAGAVIAPGVYKIPVGDRIQDALVAAGGLSGTADRVWIEKYINLAQKLSDGTKVYIPHKGEMEKIADTGVSTGRKLTVESGQSAVAGKVNVNLATSAQLDTLPGIGPATAAKIIAGRPYSTVEELKSKKAVNQSVYEKIKDLVTVY